MDPIQRRAWFDSEDFADKYHTEEPLGAFCGKEGTVFRLWAPTAQSVALRLYRHGNGGAPASVVFPESGEKGTWFYRTQQDLDGWYYDYEVTVDGVSYITQDPYAVSSGVNGQRSMVLDLRRTDPEGWEKDCPPEPTPEQVIYELHIRDFSWDPASGFREADRGRFSALTRSGTTLNDDGIHPTGTDYLKWLGVTHIQILPMYDYGSVDEENPESLYNWGYDPVNYNIPEGSYSSDPYHGEVRVREMKEMIAALHRNGFRVIMDVVYNHTYELQSCLWKTVPWYFYRQDDRGGASNGSGCGNDIASERSMCARYILESVLYWAEEYHIDGFRFDLMGLLDAPLMERIRKALDDRYGIGEKLVYGEPWRAGDTFARAGTVLCTKDQLKALDSNIGAFCDDIRDAVKGSVMDIEAVGFVNGGQVRGDVLGRCITAWTGTAGPNRAPSQVISYLSCHDDWTLWDKLVYTMDPEKNYTGCAPEVLRANRLAAAIYFCCQGSIFFLAGEEFARTKGGIKNSYCSSSEVNKLDWVRTWENRGLAEYYRGLIALRMQLPGLQDKSWEAAKRLLWTKDFGGNCAGVCMDNGESQWSRLLMVFNCGKEPQEISLPEGKWQILVCADSSFLWQKQEFAENSAMAEPVGALILGLIK